MPSNKPKPSKLKLGLKVGGRSGRDRAKGAVTDSIHDEAGPTRMGGFGPPVSAYWLRVSGVARVGEHARSGEDLELSRRCDGFAILCVRSRNFIIPSQCGITTRSAPSQFGTGFLVDASRSGVG
jgi:hypothetical protein